MTLNRKEREIRNQVIDRLNAIEADDLPTYAPHAIAAFEGIPSAIWWSIDNAIGNAEKIGLEKPHLLRQIRNQPIYGKQLFKGLKP